MEVLEWIHWGLARRIIGRRAMFDRETETWSHPSAVEVLEAAGLLPLGGYLEKHQSGVAT